APAEAHVAVDEVSLQAQQLLEVSDPLRDVPQVSAQQLLGGGAALRLPDEFGAGHLGCFLESLAFRLAAQPGKGGDRLPAPDAPAHATLAVDVHDHVAHLATGSAASPQDAAV